MNRKLLTGTAASAAAVLLAGIAPGAVGQDTPPEVPPEEIHAPSGTPDRVVLTPTSDPATSQSVTWRTDAGVTDAQGQIAVATDGPSFADAPSTVPAETSESLQADLGYPSQFHTVTFDGLEPDTAYLYRVGDGSSWSEWFEFSTAPAEPEDFSFVYYGDAQNDVKEHVSRVFRNAFRDRPEADLWLHAGDLVNTADADAEWGEWFGAAGWVNGMKNVIATPGNHEYESGQLSPQWRPQFAFPDNGPDDERLEGTVYYVDYQGVRFVSLNTNVQSDDRMMVQQAEWLDEVLEENPHKWSVVFFHHPTFSVSEGRDNPKIRQYWLPVLEEHEVDLVLQGHDHSYGRGNLDSAENGSVLEHDGTVYVVSVAGPKMYDVDGSVWDDNDAHLRHTAQDTQLYQLIDVTGDTITYEARTANGEYHDGFVLTKDDEGNKLVVENEEPSRPRPPDDDDDDDGPEPPDYDHTHEVVDTLTSITGGRPAGSAYDEASGLLYVADWDSPRIWVVDVENDEVVDEIETGANVRDVALDPEAGEVYAAESGGRMGVYSMDDGSSVRGPFQLADSIHGLEVVPPAGFAVATLSNEAIQVVALDDGSEEAFLLMPEKTGGVVFDPTSLLVWVAFEADDDGEVGLRAYDLDATEVRSVEMRRRARSVDIDVEAGLLYVGHMPSTSGEAGVTVVDAATGYVVEDLNDDAFGREVLGMAVDEENGRVFSVSSVHDPAAVTVIQRK